MKPLLIATLFVLTAFTFVNKEVDLKEQEAIKWAEDKANEMDLDELIGQLFMIRAHSDLGKEHIDKVKSEIKKYKVGGMCFFQGTPMKQAELINEYQNLSETPLLIAQDAEWGLGMRFKDEDAISFPKQLTLGAIKNNDIIYEMGVEVARQLKRIGVHVNFAPVVDVNNNPANPVIHNRSFGEDIYNVAAKSYAYMKGMQDEGLMACAKHFPGHGDTDVDSHYDLPVIKHSIERIDSIELMPFKTLSYLGIKSVMTAHLQVPSIDNRENRPTSLSSKALNELLVDKIGFKGLVFTDGLEMKGVANHFAPGIMEVEALKAGNDVLLLPIDIKAAYDQIKLAIANGEMDSMTIANKAKKVLKYKYELGLDNTPKITSVSGIPMDVNSNHALALKQKLYQEAITLAKDEQEIIPIENPSRKKVASVAIGSKSRTAFQERLGSYTDIRFLNTGEEISNTEMSNIKKAAAENDILIISLHDLNIYSNKNFGISQDQLDLIFELNSLNPNTILVNFGSPYALKFFNSLPNVIQAYEEDASCQDITAQLLFGAHPFKGTLPVSVSDEYKYRQGEQSSSLETLKYGIPEKVGVNSDTLEKIEEVVLEMIDKKAAPGCQVYAIKDGQVIYDKTFGHHTFDKKREVHKEDVYDVASVTKILATTLSLMKLEQEQVIDLTKTIDYYLPEIDTSNKGDLILKDVLAHHARLPGWIAFYENTLEEKKSKSSKLEYKEDYYREKYSDSFCLKVMDEMYLRCDYLDSIYQRIYACELRETEGYRYSDLGFYLFDQIITRMTGKRLDHYANTNFYDPIGLEKTFFNPIEKCPIETIVPSEEDEYFRNAKVQGYVHDMGAAMLGGVAGHAGLFSNAEELATLMQMILNGGSYGGNKYLDAYTIAKFTQRHPDSSRRGLGFDMKETNADKTLNMSEKASETAFGHLGFTGTAVFADPEHNLVYVFLSNRTYPTMENKTFIRNEYRPRVQTLLYNAIK